MLINDHDANDDVRYVTYEADAAMPNGLLQGFLRAVCLSLSRGRKLEVFCQHSLQRT